MRHDVTFPLYVEVDEIYNLACPASPSTTSTTRCRRPRPPCTGAINMLGLAKR
jgi:UDP-glucuronate decarboxylase